MQHPGRPVYGQYASQKAHHVSPHALAPQRGDISAEQKYDPRALHIAQRLAAVQPRVDSPNSVYQTTSSRGHSRQTSRNGSDGVHDDMGLVKRHNERGTTRALTSNNNIAVPGNVRPLFPKPPLSPPTSPTEFEAGEPAYATAVPIRSTSLRNLVIPRGSGPASRLDVPRTIPSIGSGLVLDGKRRSSQTDPQYLPSPPIVDPIPRSSGVSAQSPKRPDSNDYLHIPTPKPRSISGSAKSTDTPMLLQVTIPSHRLGVPFVGERGTIYLHESFYGPSLDDGSLRVSDVSGLQLHDMFPAPPGRDVASPYLNVQSPPMLPTPASTPVLTPSVAGENVFDSFINDSEDPKYIVYTSGGRVLAATPARLVAQITHARFLDYDLLSDFFLTYRSFMSSESLLKYLITRLRWSVFIGETGRVIRVRTFVAVRHWILNYFIDDFETDEDLRTLFCDLVNDLAAALQSRPDHGGGDLQVVGELKKCWRRTCDVVFESNLASQGLGPLDEIHPGSKKQEEDMAASHEAYQPSQTYFSRALPTAEMSDLVDLASIITSPIGPWRVRQDSIHATSCAIPMWNPLARSRPSFRPRSIIGPTVKPRLAISGIARLPSAVHRRNKSKGSKSSIDTVLLATGQQDIPVSYDPIHDIGHFSSGDLIRGIVLAPPVTQISKQAKIAQKVPFEDAIVSTPRPAGDVTFASRMHARSGVADHGVSKADGPLQKANLPDQMLIVAKSDLLTARVADEYQKLVSGEHVEVPDTTDAIDYAIQPAQYQRNRSPINLHKELPTPPHKQHDRSHSHMTTSSRSIMIINDTRNEDLEPFNYEDLQRSNAPVHAQNPVRGHTRNRTQRDIKYNPLHRMSSVASGRSDSPTRGLGLSWAESELDAVAMPQPLQHALRRVPGGNLRGVGHVDELTRTRRNSTGSIAAQRSSRASTMQSGLDRSNPALSANDSPARKQTSNTGSLQLLNTSSSAPDLRASFQVAAERLASLPAEMNLDGGVESTLAKLEGRLPSPRTPLTPLTPEADGDHDKPEQHGTSSPEAPTAFAPEGRPKQRGRVRLVGHPDHPETSRLLLDEPMLSPVMELDDARSSHGVANRPRPHDSDPFGVDGKRISADREIIAPIPRKSDSLTRQNWPLTDMLSREHRASTRMSSSTPKGSFFLEDDESLSGDEDEPAQSLPLRGGHHSFFLDETADDTIVVTPTNKTRFDPPMSPPPTTPLPPVPFPAPALHDPMPQKAARRLRTPGPEMEQEKLKANGVADRQLVTSGYFADQTPKPIDSAYMPSALFSAPPSGSLAPPRPLDIAHTPFILSINSEVLAAQFTVIERDALTEIDWKELVELKWSATPNGVSSWTEYMRQSSQSGVDIVMARSHLVVKWAISEILLTADMHDRARTVTKLIHIAAHARRLRNFATMYQLTVALLSAAVSRLSKTWTLVGQSEKDALAALETLVQPTRNFARLRQEMETALVSPGLAQRSNGKHALPATGGQNGVDGRESSLAGLLSSVSGTGRASLDQAAGGAMATTDHNVFVRVQEGACIPFVGVYTQDLTNNATKPAFVDDALVPVARPDGERTLVNFERFQTAAGMVKSLLRLLEASAKYSIRANKDMVARCLWLAALDEREIEARSRTLEVEV